jgi:N-acetylmuramic acid 6-phosphate etherase
MVYQVQKNQVVSPTEQQNPLSHGLHQRDIRSCVELIVEGDRQVVPAVRRAIPQIVACLEDATGKLNAKGRIIYIGAGTSGRLGVLDASELPPTFHLDPDRAVALIAGGKEAVYTAVEGAEDDPLGAKEELKALNLSSSDFIIAISTSATTPYCQGALKLAKELQPDCLTCLVCCVPPNDDAIADHVICALTGPEIITGSTRLKGGTATKIVLNILSTVLMIQEGRVYDNLMVGLRATNSKLRDRAIRIVATLTNSSREQAHQHLQSANWCVKTATIASQGGLDSKTAKAQLNKVNGRLHEALASYSCYTPEGLSVVIDGGGSKTRLFVLNREGEKQLLRTQQGVVTDIVAGPSNLHSNDLWQVKTQLQNLLAQAALDRTPLTQLVQRNQVYAGIAGAHTQSDKDQWKRLFSCLGFDPDKITVMGDADFLLHLIPQNSSGLVLITGTGSAVLGKSKNEQCRAGGLGYLLGDPASGTEIAKLALESAIAADEGWGVPTPLVGLLKSLLGTPQLRELLRQVHCGEIRRDRFAAAAPEICAAAEGEPTIQAIVSKTVIEFCNQAQSAANCLPDSPEYLFLCGGLLQAPYFVSVYEEALRAAFPHARLHNTSGDDPVHLAAREYLKCNI